MQNKAYAGHESKIIAGGEDRLSEVTHPAINPATVEEIGRYRAATVTDVAAAVEAASRAFEPWATLPIEDRRAALCRAAARITEHRDELARLLTQEQGKPLGQAEQEVTSCSQWLEVISGQDLPVTRVELPERSAVTTRVPLGVVAAITPWNFPLLLAIYKIAPALLTGNTVVMKPSPFTTLCSIRLVEILQDLVPAGVLSIVTGGGDVGAALVEHPEVAKISFTGSTATGKQIMRAAAGTLKRLTLELGGNDAAIVLPDVDVEQTAKDVFWAAFFNSGQLCVASKRIYVHDQIYDRFAKAMASYAREVTMGDGLEQGTLLGPINNRLQYDRLLDLIEDSRRSGHRFLVGGQPNKGPGYFIPVTLVDNPPEDSRVVQEEAFGPVAPLLRFASEDEVVARANASPLGLGGSVWTSDRNAAERIAARLATGNVWINQNGMFHPSIPYPTSKQSGIGVENGIEGLISYTNAKTIIVPKSAVCG